MATLNEAPSPGAMPAGNVIALPIRPSQERTVEGGAEPVVFTDDAAATLAWQDYQRARNYVESNLWLLEWQATDIIYQSPTMDRYPYTEHGRPGRVSRFLVAKNVNTIARQVKRALFSEQVPFFLRPSKDTTQTMADAWTVIISKLLQRMNFQYHSGLLIDCQCLQGTGIGKAFWDTRKVRRKIRRRKKPPLTLNLPLGARQINTAESDEFEVEERVVEESWPCFEYRKLGTTLFDPKWNTPNRPDLSGNYCIDIDYVNFQDLQQMRQLECYRNIPDEATLRQFFFERPVGDAPVGTQVEQNLSSESSPVTHAEARASQTSDDPLLRPLMLIERWDCENVQTLLCYEGRHLCIRNEAHDNTCIHVTANWWNIDNCGLGIGIGRATSADQRINQGVLNECLRMIAYPMNAPLLLSSGLNAPTQNVIHKLGGFWQIDGMPPGTDLKRAVGFLEMPAVPADAWHMLELSQQSGEDVSGANSAFMQGNLPGPGSSAARTATGAARIANKADETISSPVEAVSEGVIVRVVYWLVEMVKEMMPLWEIREILSAKYAKAFIDNLFLNQLLNAEFEVLVLAGEKLAKRQGIQQVIPFFMQMVQQPQLLQFMHARGDTIDFATIVDLLMQVAELQQQPDIIRPLTDQERKSVQASQAAPQAAQNMGKLQVEQVRGQNRIQEIHAAAQDDMTKSLVEKAMDRTQEGLPLERAMAMTERGADEQALQGGLNP